jgi:hypothetical protein
VARATVFLVAIRVGAAFLLRFLAATLALAGARRFGGRFMVGRLAERRAADAFLPAFFPAFAFAAFAGFPRLAAFRLAINPVLSEP